MSADDRSAVRDLLGRDPEGQFDVVVRDALGRPRVIRNAPFLDDGTPMPTRYWLVGRADVRAVSQLEAAGGVRAAEAAVDPAALAAAHARYAAERDAAIAELADGGGLTGPAPSGGVGGTRQGVKCLHAHYAWHLAGGDDPVGRWIADRLASDAGVVGRRTDANDSDDADAVSGQALDIAVEGARTTFRSGATTFTVPVGPASLVAAELSDPDPPGPAQLTNAIGLVADHLDDLVREAPSVLASRHVHVAGSDPWHLAIVERGGPIVESPAVLDRDAAEEVFRLLATETRAERLHNPGLEPERVDTVLGACCVVVAVMRRLHLDQIAVSPADAA
jgi:hypothetical protein